MEQTITLQKKASICSLSNYILPSFSTTELVEKLIHSVKCSNFLSKHNTINKKSPAMFEYYFVFYETTGQHQTINSISSTYRFPTGSLMLPIYRTDLSKTMIKYICSHTWNLLLKMNIEKYNGDPLWMNKTNINSYIDKDIYWRSISLNIYRPNYIRNITGCITLEILILGNVTPLFFVLLILYENSLIVIRFKPTYHCSYMYWF